MKNHFSRSTHQQKMSSPFKSDCLQGKVALVTGGGSGICYEISRQLLLHGCRGIVICGRRESVLRSSATTLNNIISNCTYTVCDVRDPKQCKAAVQFCIDTYGQLDILINGAAGNFLAEASALSPNGFKTVMEIDALGTFNMCHASFPYLKQHGDGRVINISATLQYGATWFQVHASAAKSAVDSMTRTLALEWGIHKIRVNAIAPGPIQNTPGTAKLAPGANNDIMMEQIPLGRMGDAFDIAMTAIFLCSSAGSFISGDVLVVDGAHWLYKPPIVPREVVSELSRKMESNTRRSLQQQKSVSSKL